MKFSYMKTCNCFTGDTKIPLLNGEILSLRDVFEKFKDRPFWVFSSNEEGDFVPAKAVCLGETGKVSNLIKIILDNDKEVVCTTDHLFRLKDGTYRQAKYLSVEDSLLPIDLKLSEVSSAFSERYLQVKLNSVRGYKGRPIYRMVHREVMREIYGEAPKGVATHHVDFSTENNVPENLKRMKVIDHWLFHSKLGKENIRNAWKKAKTDLVYMEKIRKNNIKAGKISYQKRPDVSINPKGIAFCKSDKGRQVLSDCSKKRKRDLFGKFIKDDNHKIKKIKVLNFEIPVSVYDLYVEKYHNFALDAGVYVHNCPGWVNYSKRECKHVRSVLGEASEVFSSRKLPVWRKADYSSSGAMKMSYKPGKTEHYARRIDLGDESLV